MDYRPLGQSGLRTAPIIFGGNVLGWTLDDRRSFDMLDACLDAGLNTIDTADVYSRWVPEHTGGESETVLGQYFKARGNRNRFVLATKVGMDLGNGKKGLSKNYIIAAVEDSLRRLQTDYIDLYQSHIDDEDTALEETLEAYERLIEQGKVRAIGASNYQGERLEQALELAETSDLPRYQTLQPCYNLYERAEFERNLAPVCRQRQIAVIPYFALASGFLTGKYHSHEEIRGTARERMLDKYFNDRGMAILAALDEVSQANGSSPATVALAWLMSRPGVTAPIASATSTSQLKQLMAATTLRLDQAALARLERASAY